MSPKRRIFKRPQKPMDIAVSVRLKQEQIDRINELVEIEHRTASEIVRDAILQYRTES